MSEPLNERNGIICHFCFVTIDLTKLGESKRGRPERSKVRSLFSTDRGYFRTKCPTCNQVGAYDFDEVKPINPNIEQINDILAKLEQEKSQAIADAKRLAQELDAERKKHGEPETEEPEGPNPASANPPKPPNPLEKKQAGPGVY